MNGSNQSKISISRIMGIDLLKAARRPFFLLNLAYFGLVVLAITLPSLLVPFSGLLVSVFVIPALL